jgi:hypothetical protein
LLHDFGVQLDGALGDVGGNALKGVGGHAFYRDPSQGLAGVTAERGWYANQYFNRVGAEGELYRGDITYSAAAGYQNGFVNHGEYTNLDVSWYLDDNFSVTPGFRNSEDHDWGQVAAEWQPGVIKEAPSLTLFASAGAGNYGYAFGLAGFRYYFGDDKTLIDRHRQDDPASSIENDLTSNASQFAPAPPAIKKRPIT